MPRLEDVQPEEATGTVKELFNAFEQKLGKVINIFKGMGNSPATLQAYVGLSSALAQGELSPVDREAIYLAISQRNQCNYCVSAHTFLAKNAGITDRQIAEFRQGKSSDPKLNTLIRFANRIVDTTGFVDDADIEAMQAAGYSDSQISEVVAYIALITFTNLFNHVYDTELDFPQAPPL